MKYINTLPRVEEYFEYITNENLNFEIEFDDILNGSAINKHNSIVYSEISDYDEFVNNYLSKLFLDAMCSVGIVYRL